MDVTSATANLTAASGTAPAADVRQALQVKLLQKQLEMQETTAQQLMQAATGKGKLIDIRA